MIVVRVELHSAITDTVTELARATICNVGGTDTLANYQVKTYRGRSTEELNQYRTQRFGIVENHPRKQQHVWHLIAKALYKMGYDRA